ncbi:MAG TPA: HYR domain-containing protein, partial [Bacteroidetes bacterium]|nr:HYR domain-containing protein [Bacteroidota bacterium]
CQNITVQLNGLGNVTVSGSMVDGGSTDACGISGFSLSDTSFTCSDIGPNTVTLTVLDNNSNMATCTATIMVMDTVPPIAICQNISLHLNGSGMASLIPGMVNNGSSDACGIASTAISQTAFACADIGGNSVILTVTDNNNNVSSCTAIVTVLDTVPPNAICQNLTVHLTASGNATLAAAMVNNGSTDACGIAGMVISDTAFGCAQAGANTVTLTVTDNNGNAANCTATIMVIDSIPPMANCQNVTVHLDGSGNVALAAASVNGNSMDACGIGSLVVSDTSFTCSDVGANTVTLTVSDNSGNSATCSATVTVMDTVPPMASCQNVTVQLDPSGNVNLSPGMVNNGSSDACGISAMMVSNTAFACADVGPNTVTLTVTDNNSNVATCNATVTVMDTVPPMAICQNLTLHLNSMGTASLTAAMVNNGSSDACGIAGMMVSDTILGCAQIGSNAVILTVADNNGNTATCTATITVMDTIPPLAICQNATVHLDGTGNASISAASVNNGSSDACGLSGMAVTPATFNCSNVGANTVTLTVTDVNNNTSSCSATVTVMDTVPPTAICQSVTLQLDALGNANLSPGMVNNGSSDACGISAIMVSPTTFTCAEVGPNNVTLTATDNNGNMSTCTATVTVLDTISPLAVCQNVTIQLAASGNAALAAAMVNNGSTDACGIAGMIVSDTAFGCAQVGPNTVTLTVTDNNANSATCTATITVEDTVPPVALCQNVTLQLDASGNASLSPGMVNAGSGDACGIANMTISDTAFTCAQIGNNAVTLTVTDNNNNVATCNATATVMDTVPPTAICAAATVFLDGSGMGSLSPNDVNGGSSDACGIAGMQVSKTLFGCADLGSNSVTLTVTDSNSNSSTCIATVTVSDTIPPMAVCLADTVWLDAAGNANITVMDVNGGSTDNCSIMSTSLSSSSFNCSNVGPPSVLNELFISEYLEGSGNNKCLEIYNGTGATVNMAGYSIEVYANGASSPTNTLNLTGAVIDGDVFVACNSGAAAAFTSLADQISSLVSFNGDDAVVLKHNGIAIDIFGKIGQDPGAAWNQSGNSTINHTLVRNPNIFQGNIDDLLNFPSLGTEWGEFASNFSANLGSHSLIPSGATVTLSVTDSSGNIGTCTAAIAVFDTVAPSAVCQTATIYLNASGNGTLTATDIDGGSSDACGINNLNLSASSFNCSDLGNNAVTLTVIDLHGNLDSCTTTVNVLDTIAPVVTCQAVTVYLNASGNASIDTTQVNAGSSDACGVDSLFLSRTMLSCADLGAASITLYGTDFSGNIDSCSATVTVLDTIAPVLSCSSDTVYLDSLGAGAYASSQVAASTDNCQVDTSYLAQTSFACSDVGLNLVTFFAQDQSGNLDSCTQSLTVLDTIPPVVVCMDTTIMVDTAGNVTIDVSFVNAGSSDACGVDTTFLSQYTFGCANLGTNSVLLSAVDVNGNQSNCTAMVTIMPETLSVSVTAPILACGEHIACNGDSTATATAVGDGVCLTFGYLWNTGDTTGTISGLPAGTYTVTVTDQLMRSVVDSIVISEPAPLATSMMAASYVCADDSTANVDLSVTGGLDCAAYTFLWSNGATTEDLIGVTHGTYSVTVTDTLGCTISDTVTITSQPRPMVNLGPDQTKCAEDSVLVDVGPGYSTYLWSNGATTSATLLEAGAHWIEISDSLGCTNRDTIEIFNYIVADSIIAPLGSLFLCGGDNVDLMAFSGYQSYLWNTGDTTQLITVADTGGNFSVIAIDANGCQVKDTVTVEYHPFLDPRPEIIPGPQYNLCAGNIDTLDAGSGYFSYLWNTGATTRKIPISTNGVFVVTVSNGFGCSASSDTVTVTEVPLPVPTISKVGNDLYSDQVWTTYQWLQDGVPVPGGTWDSLAPVVAGAYSLIATDSNGCEGVTDTIYCNPVAIADQFTPLRGLELYPNPSNGMIYLRSLAPIDWNLTVTMTDMYGQVIKQYTMAHLVRETAFDMRDVANGMYVLEIVTEKGARATFRLVIE